MKPKKPEPVDVAVGNRVKQLRRLRKISQTELAEMIGVTFQQVQKYESGHNRISISRFVMICGALNQHPSFFFDDEQLVASCGFKHKPIAKDSTLKFADEYERLPDGQKEAIITVMQAMKRRD